VAGRLVDDDDLRFWCPAAGTASPPPSIDPDAGDEHEEAP